LVSETLLGELRKKDEIQLSVKGRKSGKEIPRPVWFVLTGKELMLLPVKGSSTQWYKNILKDPWAKISLAGQTYTGKTQPIKDKRGVSEVVELFRKKHGAGDVKKYYSKLDVAARLPLT
jgi:hypothetical protein